MILALLLDLLTWPFRPGSVPFHHATFGRDEAAELSRLLASRVGRRRIVLAVSGIVDSGARGPLHPTAASKIRAALDAATALEPGLPGAADVLARLDVWEVMSS